MPQPTPASSSEASLDPLSKAAPLSGSSFPPDWRWHHAHAAKSLADVEALFPGRFDLETLDHGGIDGASALYAMRATPYYLDLAREASPSDPIWALAVPNPAERTRHPAERDDPIDDELPELRPVAGITRRYRDRVLLHPTPVCSVHCRHCFRKRLVGKAAYALDSSALDEAVAWIAGEPELHEVILTGGDPLTLSDDRLISLLEQLDRLEQITSLRLHTRMLVVNPHRITEQLTQRLSLLQTPVMVVTHFNHVRECTPLASQAVQRLRAANVDVLNQSVLLAGINDDEHSMRALIRGLLSARVRPYALHHADLVPGTSHLRTSIPQGQRLMRALRGTLPGHALPRYLLDVPGGHGKIPVEAPWLTTDTAGQTWLQAPDGSRHRALDLLTEQHLETNPTGLSP
ncbi:MAG: lysine 2,3-aminomutase [Pseudohongiellaceae bacterium]|jgi:lysine 2,3-aminomutase